jgi:KUP system potassium uptake protein
MTSNADGTPPALLHNLKHNKVLHERVILFTILTEDVPHVPHKERADITALGNGFYRIIARYGFMEDPNVPHVLLLARSAGLDLRVLETTFFLGRETLITTKKPGMAMWREHLFAFMARNAQRATAFFRIPPNRVIEIGLQIEM